MAIEEEADAGIPEWVVTFGDMMSLLLTFFIMLVSMSEIKQDEQYQAMVEAVQQQFGYDTSMRSLAPGTSRPRSSSVPNLASLGRAKRRNSMSGGDTVRAPAGEFSRVSVIRPGQTYTLGGVVYFEAGSSELSADGEVDLQIIAQEIVGKPQKIELRGHTSHGPIAPGVTGIRDHFDLAYQRAWEVQNFLVTQQSIDPARIRIESTADSEPVYIGTDRELLLRNDRVEIGLMDERVEDLEGVPEINQ